VLCRGNRYFDACALSILGTCVSEGALQAKHAGDVSLFERLEALVLDLEIGSEIFVRFDSVSH